MASARQISKDIGLRSATTRQKLKQQLSGERGASGTTDVVLPGSAGGENPASLYAKEELVIRLGEVLNVKLAK